MTASPRILGGRYEVGELIGRGGMAEVHDGYDTRLGRNVAIKILRSDLARDTTFLARFRREAQSAAGLNHPAIVAVYDSGEEEIADNTGAAVFLPYIVMERVDGTTLRDLLNMHGAFDPDEACRVTAGILSALEYAHQQGIVHRDIKPGNVMVSHAGAVKVMDFGIARALADSAATMTQSSAVIGTARYLSPEQGQGSDVDGRSDLYSVGCLLYELLTGRTPFVGDPVSLVYQHLGEQPQPPSVYQSDLAPALDAVVLHALVKNRDERYQDAGEFRDDVLAARARRPISAAAQATATRIMSTRGESDGSATSVIPRVAPAAPAAAAATAVEPEPAQEVVTTTVTETTGDHTAEMPLEEQAQRRRRRMMGGLLGLLGLAALIFLLWWFNSGPGSHKDSPQPTATSTAPQVVTVPDVTGWEQGAATKELRRVGLQYQTYPQTDSGKQEGTVVRQVPTDGTLAAGGTVQLFIATGTSEASVPNVLGKPQAEAEALLRDNFTPRTDVTHPLNTPDYAKGQVAQQTPESGSLQKKGSVVTLRLASGKVEMPALEGKREAESTNLLEQVKLHSQVTLVQSATAQPGTVIKQQFAPKSLVDQGSTVRIEVAEAPPPPTVAPTTVVITETQTQVVTPTATPTPPPSPTSEPSPPPAPPSPTPTTPEPTRNTSTVTAGSTPVNGETAVPGGSPLTVEFPIAAPAANSVPVRVSTQWRDNVTGVRCDSPLAPGESGTCTVMYWRVPKEATGSSFTFPVTLELTDDQSGEQLGQRQVDVRVPWTTAPALPSMLGNVTGMGSGK